MDFMQVLTSAFSSALGPQAIVFALAAIGLNIHFGSTCCSISSSSLNRIRTRAIAVSVGTAGSRRITSDCILLNRSASVPSASSARRASASLEGRRA